MKSHCSGLSTIRTRALITLQQAVLLGYCVLGVDSLVEAKQDPLPEIAVPGLSLQVSVDGKATGTSAAGTFTLRAEAKGCEQNAVEARVLGAGGIEIIREMKGPNGQRCQIRDLFQPTSNSLRWTVLVEAEGKAWTTPIKMNLVFDEPADMQQWRPGLGSDQDDWRDPLDIGPPTIGEWVYGRYQGLSLPLGSMLRSDQDEAVSFIASPEEILLGLHVHTLADGVALVHSEHRFGEGRTAKFVADLVAHPADPRGALNWITTRYPSYFEPQNPAGHQLAGCAAYSSSFEVPDVEKMKKMAFRINWNANFEWPYLGMGLPPMKHGDDPWVCSDPYKKEIHREMTYNRLNDYGRRMRESGFCVLNYFTTTEFGTFMKTSAEVDLDLPEDELWKDCTSFAFRKIEDGILRGKGDVPVDNGWKNGFGMDCGGANYRQFLLDQARLHVKWLPDFDGICIDRLDWLNQVNYRGDDGVGLYNGKPGRIVRLSWLDLMSELVPIFHNEGKVVFGNPCSSYRLAVARHLDGIYDEFGHIPKRLNASTMLCLKKPLLAWTNKKSDVESDPDAFFHRHLHVGAYPTAPYPENNHTITPDEWVEEQYIAYGPLMDAFRGRVWVLTPHCIEVQGSAAKANLFEVPDGWVAPITFAAEDKKTVTVLIHGVEGISNQLHIDALQPGVEQPKPVTATERDKMLVLQVPVHRGCAMVRLRHAAP